MKAILFIVSVVIFTNGEAQYAPPAGQVGSTAFSMHSNQFVGWASGCIVERGWQNIADTSIGKVTHGIGADAIGSPNPNVVSLGDGGVAILTFDTPIINKQGFDFAVFENSFDDYFLELAFVEVSTNGIDYVRFSSVSLTDTINQVGSFGTLEASKIYNLAGKYRGKYSTPFDLEELKDSLKINVDSINYIKIIDVVGSIKEKYASYDSKGNVVNDPYPTSFATGGFDLDAVGIIDESIEPNLSIGKSKENKLITQNLIKRGEVIQLTTSFFLFNSLGEEIGFYEKGKFNTSILGKGMYLLKSEKIIQKIIVY